MFQVASHPASFSRHGHGHHVPTQAPPASPSLQLPRTLARPQFTEVSRDAITAASPDLANVPPEYIRRSLRDQASAMLGALSGLSGQVPTSLPKSQTPSSFTISTRNPAAAPTHILAVSTSKSSRDQAMMFPIHSVVLASQCAQLPRLPSTRSSSSSKVQLPVLPLALPSSAAFAILHSYLYTHRLDSILKGLFPMPSGFLNSLNHDQVRSTLQSGQALHQLSSYLCASASNNLQTLMSHAAHVKELWQDMIALGLYDPELWDTIDLAWEVILGALNIAAASS